MAINLNKLKTLSRNVQIAISVVPSVLLVAVFIFLVLMPKSREIGTLKDRALKLDQEITSSETKVKRLDALIAENKLLKEKLSRLKEQLPEEKEVSVLLKQISEQGLSSGLEILLWRPDARKNDPEGLYVEIPVTVNVIAEYHKLGDFLSHISRLPRLVNISDMDLKASSKGKEKKDIITINFTARTFASVEQQVGQEAAAAK